MTMITLHGTITIIMIIAIAIVIIIAVIVCITTVCLRTICVLVPHCRHGKRQTRPGLNR